MRLKDMSLFAFHTSTQLWRSPLKCSESLKRDSASAVCHSSAITTTVRPSATAGAAISNVTCAGTESWKSWTFSTSASYTPPR